MKDDYPFSSYENKNFRPKEKDNSVIIENKDNKKGIILSNTD